MKTNINVERAPIFTHAGGQAAHITPLQQLQRTVAACLLWEDGFYESGQSVADRIKELVPQCKPADVADLALVAREKFKLRHAPLLLVRELSRDSKRNAEGLVRNTLAQVIQRADELTEFLAIYWKEGRKPLAKQVKQGLQTAFRKFDAYQLAKYNRDATVKLRDVLRLVHPTPVDEAQSLLWKHLINGTLKSPDTWEVALSAGKDKKETFERLLSEDKLGYLALLRNLRNMVDAGVESGLVRDALLKRRGAEKVLPFRFVAAAKAAPRFEPELDRALLATLGNMEKLPGKTVAVIDVSGSMYHSNLSGKSDMTRAHAACALAAILRELCEDPVIYATAGDDYTRVHKTKLVPARRGMALVDAVYKLCRPLGGGGIFLRQVMEYIKTQHKQADRVIVITDEQDCDVAGSPSDAPIIGKHNYIINVASEKRGIAYQKWTHINGFSESVVKYIAVSENFSFQ